MCPFPFPVTVTKEKLKLQRAKGCDQFLRWIAGIVAVGTGESKTTGEASLCRRALNRTTSLCRRALSRLWAGPTACRGGFPVACLWAEVHPMRLLRTCRGEECRGLDFGPTCLLKQCRGVEMRPTCATVRRGGGACPTFLIKARSGEACRGVGVSQTHLLTPCHGEEYRGAGVSPSRLLKACRGEVCHGARARPTLLPRACRGASPTLISLQAVVGVGLTHPRSRPRSRTAGQWEILRASCTSREGLLTTST